MSSNRLQWIDICKGFAICAVVLVHFNQEFCVPFTPLARAASIGARGPQLFFIISAFLTWFSLSKRYTETISGYTGFVRDRLKRLLPEYYLALFLSVITFFAGLGYPNEPTGGGIFRIYC